MLLLKYEKIIMFRNKQTYALEHKDVKIHSFY